MRLGGGKKADDKKALIEGIIFNRAGDLDTRFYPVKKRAVSGAVKIGGPGLAEAVQIVIKDMNVYLARKNKESSDKLGL
jgi:phage terminase large subunit-like protein